jgi:hypothetical protein
MSERKRINQYAKRAEDKMEKKLKEIGFELIEDTGRRTQKLGDRIMKHTDTGLLLVADHKSTQSKEEFRVRRIQLRKIKEEAESYSSKALGAITFTMKGDNRMYAIIDIDDLEGVLY